MGKVVIQDFTR